MGYYLGRETEKDGSSTIKVHLLDVLEENDRRLQDGFVFFELELQLLLQHGNVGGQLGSLVLFIG